VEICEEKARTGASATVVIRIEAENKHHRKELGYK